MKYPIIILAFIVSLSCKSTKNQKVFTDKSTIIVPLNTIDKVSLDYDTQTSLWTYNGVLYNGYAESYYETGLMKERISFLNGKKHGVAKHFFQDGHLKEETNYNNGKLDGTKKIWSNEVDHTLIANLNYKNGKAHGEQTKWYTSGELYQKLQLNMGKEEGLQQAFRKNGVLYANYEAKDGRIFGLKKAELCFGLEDEKIVYEN